MGQISESTSILLAICGPQGQLTCGDRLAVLHSLVVLQQSLEPAQHSRPAAVALGHFGMSSEPAVSVPDERAVARRLQLPTNRCFYLARPARGPGVD